LNESFVLSKDGLIGVKFPVLPGGVFLDHLLALEADVFPLSAAVDALLEIRHAFFNISFKHVVLIDLGSASLNDLVADLSK
jgi:hypothetical protein